MAATAHDLSNASSVITLTGVNKWFGQFHVLSDINLDVKLGEKIVICGPSGSGKSTLIRCINRLEEHQAGDIVVDGVTLSNDVRNIEAIRREVGMVFQSFNLYPHMTALGNVTLALRKVLAKRVRPTYDWRPVMSQFAVLFGERFSGREV